MKKNVGVFLLVFALLGCHSNDEKTLNLNQLNQELPLLSEEQFDINHVMSSVEYDNKNLFGNMIDVFDYDYDTLGISKEDVLQATIRLSPDSCRMYMVFKPVSGHEESLKKSLQNYLSKRIVECKNDEDKELLENAMLIENENFLALIVSDDNESVLERIENAKQRYFGVLSPISDQELSEYGLNKQIVSEYAIQKPVMTSASTYLIVKPVKGKEEEVKNALSDYLKKLESDYASMPEQQELVHQAMVCELEDYQIVIISKNNEAVLESIKTYMN